LRFVRQSNAPTPVNLRKLTDLYHISACCSKVRYPDAGRRQPVQLAQEASGPRSVCASPISANSGVGEKPLSRHPLEAPAYQFCLRRKWREHSLSRDAVDAISKHISILIVRSSCRRDGYSVRSRTGCLQSQPPPRCGSLMRQFDGRPGVPSSMAVDHHPKNRPTPSIKDRGIARFRAVRLGTPGEFDFECLEARSRDRPNPVTLSPEGQA